MDIIIPKLATIFGNRNRIQKKPKKNEKLLEKAENKWYRTRIRTRTPKEHHLNFEMPE